VKKQPLPRRRLDLNVDACWKAQFIESLNRSSSGLLDVDQTLVRSDLKLLTSFLVDVRTRQYGIPLNSSRQRNRPMHFGMGSLGRLNNLGRTLVENRMVVCFHSDADDFMRSRHSLDPFKKLSLTVRFSGVLASEFHLTNPASNAGRDRIGGVGTIVNCKSRFSTNLRNGSRYPCDYSYLLPP
jgi:hypothetical protein